ncbi:MAG: tRNA (cytidine(34)-2'-O)-methyltransferase [Verrucomicrobiota bacterium]
MLHVVLYEPEIPPNTGNIGRLCHATDTRLHLIEPLGFDVDERSLKRAGLDYWGELDLRIWPSWEDLLGSANVSGRYWLFTTKTNRVYWDAKFADGDALVFGPETRGLPKSLLASRPDDCLTLPQTRGRSLNLATAAGIGLFEAKRQLKGMAQA